MEKELSSLLLRNLLFTLLQPGVVTALLPYWILSNAKISIEFTTRLNGVFGLLVYLTGLMILLKCILQFAFEGKGTLSPVDPTKKLVTKGLYRYSRNPMYIGVLTMLAGEYIYFGYLPLLYYAIAVLAVFHLFIIFHEEPRLIKVFGHEYSEYCNKVRRWC